MLLVIVHAVPTGLLALQGTDELGKYLRSHLKKLGVSTDFIRSKSSILANAYVAIKTGTSPSGTHNG